MKGASKTKRNKELVAYYRSGRLASECAEKFGISRERVRQILTEMKVKSRSRAESRRIMAERGLIVPAYTYKERPLGPVDKKREGKIIRLIDSGLSYGRTAKKLGVTRNAVAGALHRYRLRTEYETRA